jgi:hypothetical protein
MSIGQELMNTRLSPFTEELQKLSAHAASDFFLSPYVNESLFLESTADEGPTLWIVNRSDVYNETLDILTRHQVPGIRDRAQDKLHLRSGLKLQILPEAEPFTVEKTKNYSQDEIEEILGHPLAPFEAMLFFLNDLNEDTRVSAALSLTRRLLEHPPNWIGFDPIKTALIDSFFEKLLNDSSAYSKSFMARIPLFSPEQILLAIEKENHPFILGRLFQNPAFTENVFDTFLKKLLCSQSFQTEFLKGSEFLFPRTVLFLDRRMTSHAKNDLWGLFKKIAPEQRDLSLYALTARG